jgi:hypothetical protein
MMILAGLGIIAIIWGTLIEFGLAPSPYANTTRTEVRLHNIGGDDYEVTYTSSDTLAKNEWISVYVSKTRSGVDSLVPDWLQKKTLLFRYDPAISIDPPAIEEVGPHVIRISISRVSSIFYKRGSWDDLSIEYQIGSVDYP